MTKAARRRGKGSRKGQLHRQPSAFFPLALLEVCVVMLAIWDIRVSIELKSGLEATKASQQVQVSKSEEMDAELQSITVDLIDLAKTDPHAEAIVDKERLSAK